MTSWHEDVFDARSTVVEGMVVAIDDTGQAQTVDVQTHDGIVRTGIEVKQLSGFASRAPMAGATVLLLAVGGDVGHYVAMPLFNPSVRFGNLAEGDGGVLYAPDGSRVAVMAGGVVQIVGMTQVSVLTEGVRITAPSGVTIAGPVTITGALSVSGDAQFAGNVNVADTVNAGHVNSRS